jgi:hypothetical protein
LPLAWIANRLQTGTRGHAGRLIQQRARCLRPTRSGERLRGTYDNLITTPPFPDWQKVFESKRGLRRNLAARPIAEKLHLLDACRDAATNL